MKGQGRKIEKENKYENYINKYNRENKKTEISKYNIKIEDFEGPLDLLCFLIKKNKMNIDNINIYKIIEDYLEYIYIMESLNLEIATEFITMASMLIYIKSKKILPKVGQEQEDDEISEEALKEKVSVKDKIKEMFTFLSKIPKFIFNTMFLNKNKSKDEIISAFLGILEMAKKNEVKIKQENIFSDILVEKSNEK